MWIITLVRFPFVVPGTSLYLLGHLRVSIFFPSLSPHSSFFTLKDEKKYSTQLDNKFCPIRAKNLWTQQVSIPHPRKFPILKRRIYPKKLPKVCTRVACFAILSECSSVSLLELAQLSCDADKLSPPIDSEPLLSAYKIPIPDTKRNRNAFSEETCAKHEVTQG